MKDTFLDQLNNTPYGRVTLNVLGYHLCPFSCMLVIEKFDWLAGGAGDGWVGRWPGSGRWGGRHNIGAQYNDCCQRPADMPSLLVRRRLVNISASTRPATLIVQQFSWVVVVDPNAIKYPSLR